jgi:hypothetical protein
MGALCDRSRAVVKGRGLLDGLGKPSYAGKNRNPRFHGLVVHLAFSWPERRVAQGVVAAVFAAKDGDETGGKKNHWFGAGAWSGSGSWGQAGRLLH